MAEGDFSLVNLTGATFVLTAETGGIIQSEDRSIDCNWKDVFDASVGDYVGFVAYAWKAMQDFKAILNGVTGIALAQPGVALTLANDLGIGTPKNGVAAGGLFCKSLQVSHQGEDLRQISGNTVQRARIPVPS